MKTLFLFGVLILVIGCGTTDSHKDPPGIAGKLVFSAEDENGFSQIYTMNANGTDLRQLTHFVGGGAVQPAWSPDGSRIAFASYAGATTLGAYLYIMDADGKNMRFLKRFKGESPKALVGNYPDWSPDGSKIAYTVCTNCELGGSNYEISVVEVAGEVYDPDDVYSITNNPASDRFPTWSPDGNSIAFSSDRDYPKEGGYDVYLIDILSKSISRLTETGNAGRQLWYPYGKHLLYWSKNNLYKLALSNLQSQVIFDEIDQNIGFRPLTIMANGEKVLLQVFNYANPRDEQSLQVLNLSDKELIRIYSKTAFNGADWHTSTRN